MSIGHLLQSLAADALFQAALVLVALDLALGVLASIVKPDVAGAFNLSYVANFLRNDIAGKVLPWAALYVAAKAAPAVDILGVDLMTIASAAWIAVGVALGGSIVSSLTDLGVPLPVSVKRLVGRSG